jgi:hypothetical protein
MAKRMGGVEQEWKHPPVLLVGAVVSGDLNEEGFVIRRSGGQEGEKSGGGFAHGKVGRENISDRVGIFRRLCGGECVRGCGRGW